MGIRSSLLFSGTRRSWLVGLLPRNRYMVALVGCALHLELHGFKAIFFSMNLDGEARALSGW